MSIQIRATTAAEHSRRRTRQTLLPTLNPVNGDGLRCLAMVCHNKCNEQPTGRQLHSTGGGGAFVRRGSPKKKASKSANATSKEPKYYIIIACMA